MPRPLLSLLVAVAFFACACQQTSTSERVEIVEGWEGLGEVLLKHHADTDCAQVNAELTTFYEANSAIFSRDRAEYEALLTEDFTLRLRFAQAFEPLHDVSFECKKDQNVQRTLQRFFAPLRAVESPSASEEAPADG